jgi:glyoxalase family protein
VLSFLVRPETGEGRAGAGVVHRIRWRVASIDALVYWYERLENAQVQVRRVEAGGRAAALRFTDREGLAHELVIDDSGNEPLLPYSAMVPDEHALRGLDGVRAFSSRPGPSADLLAGRLGFMAAGSGAFQAEGAGRNASYSCDEPPRGRALHGAGSVHHVAWMCEPNDLPAWRQRVIGLGAHVTPILDREHYRSIYFREPSGVLFEIASRGSMKRRAAPRPPAEPPTTEIRLPAAA